jgi:hypothetical protein
LSIYHSAGSGRAPAINNPVPAAGSIYARVLYSMLIMLRIT